MRGNQALEPCRRQGIARTGQTPESGIRTVHDGRRNMKQNIIIAVCLIAGFTAGWIVNGWRLSADSTTEKLSAVQSNADHFRDATKMINEESNQYVRKTYELKKEIDTLQKELADAKKNRPLPVECRPDPDRLRVLAEAVHTANRAAAGQ